MGLRIGWNERSGLVAALGLSDGNIKRYVKPPICGTVYHEAEGRVPQLPHWLLPVGITAV